MGLLQAPFEISVGGGGGGGQAPRVYPFFHCCTPQPGCSPTTSRRSDSTLILHRIPSPLITYEAVRDAAASGRLQLCSAPSWTPPAPHLHLNMLFVQPEQPFTSSVLRVPGVYKYCRSSRHAATSVKRSLSRYLKPRRDH